jgi:Uma2 family endonuclease
MIEGRLVMMAGGTGRHSTIAVNATVVFGNQLVERPCQVFNSDLLDEATAQNPYFPDIGVACDETRDHTDQPILVLEVLSPSTAREDLGAKLRNYLRIPGL